MLTVLRLSVFIIVFIFTTLFNIGLIDVRFEEIRYLLGTIASTTEMSSTFGIVAKYELIKRRMLFGEEQLNNYEFEARMQALGSAGSGDRHEKAVNKRIYHTPVRFVLNGIRRLLGKPIINPKEEDRIYGVLEIGYFWERSRRYTEALKIYEEVLGTPNLNTEIRAAVLVHKAFCYSMTSRYDKAKEIYEHTINSYPNTEAGILAWKLLDFINSMENERKKVKQANISEAEKAKRFYLLMDFRNAIRDYSKFLERKQPVDNELEARFYKGRSHEELGEIEDALMEYRIVVKKDPSKKWARQANRRMLMLGDFYERQKSISEEAKRQLEAYQDQMFIKNIEKYAAMVGKSTLKSELIGDGKSVRAKIIAVNDSIMKLINQIGNLDLAGDNQVDKRDNIERIKAELLEKGVPGSAEMKMLQRREYLAANPYRRPTAIKQFIDENSNELRYLYNKRLRSGIRISGKMIVEFRIKADGSVGETKIIQSNIGDEQFELSVLNRIRTWKFKAVPDSLGDLTVNYPFEFYEEDQ